MKITKKFGLIDVYYTPPNIFGIASICVTIPRQTFTEKKCIKNLKEIVKNASDALEYIEKLNKETEKYSHNA